MRSQFPAALRGSSMRQTALAQITGGAGFRVYPNKPAKLINGKTRAERKQEARDWTNAAVSAYHGDLALARNKNLIGTTYVSPDQLRRLLTQNPDTIKPAITNETVVIAPKQVGKTVQLRAELEGKTVAQLRAMASATKAKVTTKMTKAQLIDAIVGA